MEIKKVLVHPVRARLIGALGGRRLTRAQLGELVPEIPAPTLYRNLRVLVEAGVVEEVERIPRGGSQEVVYAVVNGKANVTEAEAEGWSPTEWQAGLDTFLNSISSSYRAYLSQGGGEACPAMGVILALTPEERHELGVRLHEVYAEFAHREPGAGRDRYVLSVVIQPDSL